ELLAKASQTTHDQAHIGKADAVARADATGPTRNRRNDGEEGKGDRPTQQQASGRFTRILVVPVGRSLHWPTSICENAVCQLRVGAAPISPGTPGLTQQLHLVN